MEFPASDAFDGKQCDLEPHRDLSAYSKPALRVLVASAQELARRASGEIRARKAPLPRCISPHLIMAWLPLGDLPWALRVSSTWRAASEALFQVVARGNGLMRAGTWRAAVRKAAREIRWVASLPSYYPWKGLNGPASVTARDKDLMYLRGRAIRLWPGCTTSWRVKLEKQSGATSRYINAAGFAILDPINPGRVLAAYEWNEDERSYPNDHTRCKNAVGFPVRDFKVTKGTEIRPLFEGGDRLEIKVTYKRNRIVATVDFDSSSSLYNTERNLQAIDMRQDDECTLLRIKPLDRDGRRDRVDPALGRENTLVVAPFCDLSRGSSATLSWSDAEIRGPVWREYRLSGTETEYESR